MTATKTERFSRAALRTQLEQRIVALEHYYGFNDYDGWQQVAGKPTEVIVEYGRYIAYVELVEDNL